MKLQDLIVFGEDWGGLPSSTQHLILHLADNRRIIWVNSIGLRRPKVCAKDLFRIGQKIIAKFSGKSIKKNDVHPHISVIKPLTLPAPRTKLGRKLMVWMLVKQIAPMLKKRNFHSPILWTSLPTASDIMGNLNESKVVYYCGDDFNALAGVDHQVITQREGELVNKADLVIAASPVLVEKFGSAKTKLLTHGVSFNLFSQGCDRAPDLPNNHKPIAGFYGSLSEWLDTQLLEKIIKNRSDWDFVFIGDVNTNIDNIAHLENAHFLGKRPHASLASYSQHWNVSLLPFKQNKQIEACNPLKLREYLATGNPIITTDFPAVQEYKKFVYVIKGVDEFSAALDACSHKQPCHLQKTVVKKHDWSKRAEMVSNWLNAL